MSRDLVAELFPELEPVEVVAIEAGWDCLVFEVDGAWIVRVPRRAQVSTAMEPEIRLLPELAPMLPVAVPRYELVAGNGLRAVAYRKLHGEPLDGVDVRPAADVAAFLAGLHGFPVDRAAELGVPDCWKPTQHARVADFRGRVFPLLEGAERQAGSALLDAAAADAVAPFRPVLAHADLGPEHLLAVGGRLTGVIDWTDARIGDPAIDLAWVAHGTTEAFARAVARAYGADSALLARALTIHRLSPWYEALFGVDFDRPQFVESGLAGVRARLPR